ncbi:MAG: ATP-binding cassette protein [Acidimicrobiales bacterium]|nr:ATP-binding cassette protein [Acidimicrobiales bacterium]
MKDPDGPVVICESVARTYGMGPNAVVAVHGVSCTVPRDARIALTGPSGSGKSTLLHLMAGLDVPTAGTVTWPAIGDRQDLRPGPVAIVFQGPSLIPSLDVLENVSLATLLAGVSPSESRDQAVAALEQLGLTRLTNALPDELSGGQAQRVAVARALVGSPVLLLADEPTGQLDHAAAALVIDALVHAADHLGAALVISTHDPEIAERLPTRWSMTDGRLLTERRDQVPLAAGMA